ncbi:MAG: fibrillarin-like rRNA/tRNA 2'-O-methyltransferase [archaeon]|jgi:fibrillarin-like pre-rRNA processing protein|nr:fibrillarin-like rRNA/tRNA 2'-O-methyltransferase [archaeon]
MKLLKKLGKEYATLSLVSGRKVYGERLKKIDGKEYRFWDSYRSKLSAALTLGLRNMHFEEDSTVLYLGAANGTTASHISDLVPKGTVYCVEFSPRAMADLYPLCKKRKNMVPILADANHPIQYAHRIGQVDIVYQDVAQRHQADILIKNAKMFLKPRGWTYLMVKARSIDVSENPNKLFNILTNQLRSTFDTEEKLKLDPYEKDHMCIVSRLRKTIR